MPRVILCVLDSFGIGNAPDAADYGDQGADTLLHIAEACAEGAGDEPGLRAGQLHLPNLDALGLGAAGQLSSGALAPGLTATPRGGTLGASEHSPRHRRSGGSCQHSDGPADEGPGADERGGDEQRPPPQQQRRPRLVGRIRSGRGVDLWIPGYLGPIMAATRFAPRWVWRRMPR